MIIVGEGRFVQLACRALDRDARLSFVTAWGDRPMERGVGLRPCTEAMLLGRPAAQVPTVFRRSAAEEAGGLDAALPSGREADLSLRLLARGLHGAVLDFPELAPVPKGDARPLLEKHRVTVERFAEEILVIKEHWLRALAAQSQAAHRQRQELERTRAALDAEAAALERCLERLRE